MKLRYTIEDDQTMDLRVLEERYEAAASNFAALAANADAQRASHLAASIDQLASKRDNQYRKELKALKAMQKAENQVQVFRKLRNTLKPITGASVSKVDVPKDLAVKVKTFFMSSSIPSQISTSHDSVLEEILQHTIRNKRGKDTEEVWETIIDKEKFDPSHRICVLCLTWFYTAV